MFITEDNKIEVTKRQYKYKLNAYLNAFTAMIAVQIVALLLSLLGVGSSGYHSGNLSLSLKTYSSNFVIAFTMMWGLVIGITMTTQAYRNSDFTFVTNRLTSNLSNIAFLITASIIGGLTSMLSSNVLKVALVFYYGTEEIISSFISMGEILIGLIAAILYVLLLTSVGYFVGTLSQLHSIFKIVIPVVFFGLLFTSPGQDGMITKLFQFYIGETSLLMFSGKVVVTATALFIASILVSDQLEVR
ncbi:hypothetical protein ACERII_06320 [Evansella sp. AB-rgal1]|uniref:hypothetical protein n=1 Tax=Evansella sp. AB-rgal1 TaxID=3242696 RepID=UPI00359DA201